MLLSRIVINERSPEQTIFLKEMEPEGRVLPVVIGIFEANAIQMGVCKIDTGRPFTHDLLVSLLDALNAKPEKVVITKLEQGTFFAELQLAVRQGKVSVDCRPSDAVAVSARMGIPIFVDEDVFERAAVQDIKLDGGAREE